MSMQWFFEHRNLYKYEYYIIFNDFVALIIRYKMNVNLGIYYEKLDIIFWWMGFIKGSSWCC